MCIALAAYSCRDSPGLGRRVPPLPCSLLSLFRGTGAIMSRGLPRVRRAIAEVVGWGKGDGVAGLLPLPFRGEGWGEASNVVCLPSPLPPSPGLCRGRHPLP